MIEGYEWIVTLPGLCAIALIGMLMHFFKQKIKGETITEIRDYFRSNVKSTFVAIVSTVVSVGAYYFALATEMPADIVTVFGLGYMCDSFFNKWDKQ
jgi:hypothetical protein